MLQNRPLNMSPLTFSIFVQEIICLKQMETEDENLPHIFASHVSFCMMISTTDDISWLNGHNKIHVTKIFLLITVKYCGTSCKISVFFFISHSMCMYIHVTSKLISMDSTAEARISSKNTGYKYLYKFLKPCKSATTW